MQRKVQWEVEVVEATGLAVEEEAGSVVEEVEAVATGGRGLGKGPDLKGRSFLKWTGKGGGMIEKSKLQKSLINLFSKVKNLSFL